MATEFTAGDPAGRPGAAAARGRRSFLRHGTAAALSVLGAATGTLLGSRPAAAIVNGASCCGLVRAHSPWCPYYCLESGTALSAWACNNGACLCYECYALDRDSLGPADCWVSSTDDTACSAHRGCCERNR